LGWQHFGMYALTLRIEDLKGAKQGKRLKKKRDDKVGEG